MSDQYKQPAPLFGVSLTPAANEMEKLLYLSQVADDAGLDLLAIQDHPYNPTFLDTWTLLALIGGQTRQIRLTADVSPIALRPPAMLAKAAASLDVLTGGRVEMGLGTGAYWEAIESFGGPRRKPGEAVAALREGIEIMRLLWQGQADRAGRAVSYSGQYYSLKGAQAGPAPRHSISIWLGAVGPKMLQLVGELADGWFAPLAVYVPPEQAAASNKTIDAAAVAAGRDPRSVRRIYNLPGVVLAREQAGVRGKRPGVTVGPPQRWVETLLSHYHEVGMDTFVFWPSASDEEQQIRLFAEEVAPAVRTRLSESAQVAPLANRDPEE